jgi:hypothetical protein
MKVPVNPSAPVKATGEIVIAAPASVVWTVLTGIEGWPGWQAAVTEAKLLGPLREGAEFRWKAGGVSFRSTVHTMAEHRMFGWTGRTLGAFAIHNWWFATSEGRTTVTVEESLEGFLPRLLRGWFQRTLDAGIRTNLDELRVAAEGSAST